MLYNLNAYQSHCFKVHVAMGILLKHDASQSYYINSYGKFTSIHIAVIKSANLHNQIITQTTQLRYDL